MTDPKADDARQFYDVANQFVALANDLSEEHGRPRVAAAILWAASRYGAFAWGMSGAPGRQTPADALDLFSGQYRKMMEENLRQMIAEFAPPKE